jgi:hypothetical protein
MMLHRFGHPVIISLLSAAAGVAVAQQPPDVVNSDTSNNTAMGTSALLDLSIPTAAGNTAAGSGALSATTTGSSNTAVGSGALSSNISGGENTAVGAKALASMTTLYSNTAVGYAAGYSNTSGGSLAAFGYEALYFNTTGFFNSAFGPDALYYNKTGGYNTAVGGDALFTNSVGNYNSATGYSALAANTGSYNTGDGVFALGPDGGVSSGNYNTAVGAYALSADYGVTGSNNTATGAYTLGGYNGGGLGLLVSGSNNTAAGAYALASDQSGANNTAFGYQALYSNSTGKGNAAQGSNALYSNTTGIRNLGIGSNALYLNTTGGYNIGLGFDGGYNITTGSNNIEIGASGSAADNDTIQIGVQGTQTLTTIAGIYGTMLTGSAVYVTATGQLGVLGSSERFKTDIAPMPELSSKLSQLRPVTFHYKSDPKAIQQYGLIAEEVDKVYPELVIRDEQGKIQGVRYEELAPMLLSEVQRERNEIRNLEQQVGKVNDLESELAQMRAALAALQSKDQRVAQR